MNTKRFFLFGLPVVLLALGLVLAGCDTEGGDGAESDPVAAAQLADEINAIKAGIAKVNGATVTLTGGFTPYRRSHRG
jgi:predicted small secreted protein